MIPKLIGPAGVLEARLATAIADVGGPLKLLFWGEPGVGKSELAGRLANMLTHQVEIDRVNGADVGVDEVREWAARSRCSSLFAAWRVLIIEEIDKVSDRAQVNLLTYLDELPAQRAVLATSNVCYDPALSSIGKTIPARLWTRFERYEVKAPTSEEIRGLLAERVPCDVAAMLATTCAGNVRAALLDASSYTRTNAPAKPKAVQSELLALM